MAMSAPLFTPARDVLEHATRRPIDHELLAAFCHTLDDEIVSKALFANITKSHIVIYWWQVEEVMFACKPFNAMAGIKKDAIKKTCDDQYFVTHVLSALRTAGHTFEYSDDPLIYIKISTYISQ
jgi:hypothetical protein